MIRKAIAGAVAAAAVAAPLALAAPAQASEGGSIAATIASVDRFTTTEVADGVDRFRWDQRNWYDFDILEAAIGLSSLKDAVQTDLAVTVFAPNDRAFQLLARDLTGTWYATEAGVLKAIVGAVTAGAVNLENVLGYHVVPAVVTKKDIKFNEPVPTLNEGNTFSIAAPNKLGFIEIRDEAPLRNPFIIRTDIPAGSGVIHSVSRVLVPLDFNAPAN